MALITRQAKAHILIGLAPSAVQNFKGKLDLGITHIHSRLAQALPGFNIEVFEAQNNKTSIHVFNAFLNFEIAAYENNQVHYPLLEEKIHGIIDSYFSQFELQDLDQHSGPILNSEDIKDECLVAIYWLSVINRINSTINQSTCKLYLHYSTKPDLVLKNLKNEALLISGVQISEETLLKAINLVLDVQSTGFNGGELHIKDDTPIKTNSYGAIATPNLDNEIFYEDKVLDQYILLQAENLKKIDPKDQIETHTDTIWQNFILSFRAGATSKLTKLNHQIDL